MQLEISHHITNLVDLIASRWSNPRSSLKMSFHSCVDPGELILIRFGRDVDVATTTDVSEFKLAAVSFDAHETAADADEAIADAEETVDGADETVADAGKATAKRTRPPPMQKRLLPVRARPLSMRMRSPPMQTR